MPVSSWRPRLHRRITTTEVTKKKKDNQIQRHPQSIEAWSFDKEGHAKKCVERYCELACKDVSALKMTRNTMHRCSSKPCRTRIRRGRSATSSLGRGTKNTKKHPTELLVKKRGRRLGKLGAIFTTKGKKASFDRFWLEVHQVTKRVRTHVKKTCAYIEAMWRRFGTTALNSSSSLHFPDVQIIHPTPSSAV